LTEKEPSEDELARDLKGKTLRVYCTCCAIPYNDCAEIQRGAALSSPSLSMHHLERLKLLGLVDKDVHGQYTVRRDVRVGVLKLFVVAVGSWYHGISLCDFLHFCDCYSLDHRTPDGAVRRLDGCRASRATGSVSVSWWYEVRRIWREQPFPEDTD